MQCCGGVATLAFIAVVSLGSILMLPETNKIARNAEAA